MNIKNKLSVVDDILKTKSICKDVRNIILERVKNDEINISWRRKYLESSTFSIFFSKNGDNCVIIREDHFDLNQGSHIKSNPQKCRRTHMLTWNLHTDEIKSGQWLLNKKIKMTRNMLSPDGKYFAYTMSFPKGPYKTYIGNGKGIDILTIISKPPFFSGITVLRHDLCKVYGDLYGRMMGTNWINEKTLLLKSKAKIEKGNKPKGIKISVLCVPKYDKITYSNKKMQQITLSEQYIFDIYNRKINLINGKLLVNGKEIYDFALDEFKFIGPPDNYFC